MSEKVKDVYSKIIIIIDNLIKIFGTVAGICAVLT